MKIENIYIQNLKCGGCANTVVNSLKSREGVQDVNVDVEKSLVTVSLSENVTRDSLTEILAAKGYPEEGADNSTMKKAKSYVSCMIGRMQ